MGSLAGAALLALAGGAQAATTFKIDVTVRSEPGAIFSAPIFTFTNLSTPGVQIDAVSVSSGFQWDYVLDRPAPYDIVNPAGGTRSITSGNEANFDENNGGPTTIAYALTGFDPGEFFRFSADPEGPGGQSVVVDIRPHLLAGQIGISAGFAGGPTLIGAAWTLEYVDPDGNRLADSNQIYRLTLEHTVADPQTAVPEPSAWALMIGGFGLTGATLRTRRRRIAA